MKNSFTINYAHWDQHSTKEKEGGKQQASLIFIGPKQFGKLWGSFSWCLILLLFIIIFCYEAVLKPHHCINEDKLQRLLSTFSNGLETMDKNRFLLAEWSEILAQSAFGMLFCYNITLLSTGWGLIHKFRAKLIWISHGRIPVQPPFEARKLSCNKQDHGPSRSVWGRLKDCGVCGKFMGP